MQWLRYSDPPYYGDGFVCNECASSASGYRWVCTICNDDYCGRCRPAPAGARGGAANDEEDDDDDDDDSDESLRDEGDDY
eukprot:SAG22_NODE_733_length_7580_cov_2.329501_5_plen_80_part_00